MYNWLKCKDEEAEKAAPCCNSILLAFFNRTVTNRFTLFLFLKGKGTYFISKQLIVPLQTSKRVGNIPMLQRTPE